MPVSLPTFVSYIDRSQRFVRVNPACLDWLGIPPQDAAGRTVKEVVSPDTYARKQPHIKAALRGETSIFEMVFEHTQRGDRQVRITYTPEIDGTGFVKGIFAVADDITEQRLAEKAAWESEEKGRDILESITDAFYALDRSWRFTYVNHQAEILMERPRQGLIGKNVWDEYPMIVKTELYALYHQVMNEKKVITTEVYYAPHERWYEVHAYPSATGISVYFQNITERKKAENAIRQSEERYRTLFNTMDEGFCVIEMIFDDRGQPADYRFLEVNPAFEKHTGLRNASGKTMREFAPGHEDHWFEIYGRVAATGEPTHFTQRAAKLNRWFDVHAFRLGDSESRKVAILFNDITQRKEAEEILYEVKERFRLMVESIEDYAIFSIDTAGNITTWNIGAEKIFGYAQDEIIGQAASQLFTPEDRENGMPQQEMRTATRTGRAIDERWHLRRNGERFYASGVMASIRHDGGDLRGFVKIARDETQRKEAEKALVEARNKANEANMAKSEFLTNMSHEIRTPMNAIVGLSNILAMNTRLPPQAAEMVRTLQMSAQSLMGLINDLLDIAKIETNKIELEHIPFQMADVIRDVFCMLSVKADEKHLTLEFVPSPLGRQDFIGDPMRIRQIVTNLVSNAIKFTEKGGVTVSLASTPHKSPGYDCVHLCIADTGIGIAEDKQEGIFDKFMQADTSTTRKYGGTGLGLAISKNLAEIMGGSITVKSNPGHGAEFTLHLPFRRAARVKPGPVIPLPAKQATAAIEGARILLVEDYEPNVLVASTLLEGLGYSVATASNGKEAIAKIRSSRDAYMAVLMDIQMPDMDGFEATQLIRQEERARGLPHLTIIAITAHALQGDRERCLEAGMDGYISKPFQPEKLKEVLNQLCGMAQEEPAARANSARY